MPRCAWFRNGNQRTEANPTTSNDKGFFSLPFNAATHGASKGDQQLSSYNDHYNHGRVHIPRPYDRTIFFTDRSHRPGQTVQYKGLSIHVDSHNDNYRTIPNALSLCPRDRNGKEIGRQQHRANDYGSFSGKFNAPRDRVLGRASKSQPTARQLLL